MFFDPARMVILILDESVPRRIALRGMLERIGVLSPRVAGSVAEAIERLRGETIDAVLLDDRFGGEALDFVTALRRRARGRIQSVPIILCVEADAPRVLAARDAGVNELVAKPVRREALRLRLREIVVRPRPMIRCPSYIGPCRRRRQPLALSVAERRNVPDAATRRREARGQVWV